MKRYIVRATRLFYDYLGKDIKGTDFITREKGDIFECEKERYLYLKENNVVELMAILN